MRRMKWNCCYINYINGSGMTSNNYNIIIWLQPIQNHNHLFQILDLIKMALQ